MALPKESNDAWREKVDAVPPGWHRRGGRGVETGETLGADALVRNVLRRAAVVPIWSIRGEHGHRQLRKPLAVALSQDGDYFFAANEELNLIGTGVSPHEAVQDLLAHVEHFEEEYRSLAWDRVTGDAVRLKKLFESLFVA